MSRSPCFQIQVGLGEIGSRFSLYIFFGGDGATPDKPVELPGRKQGIRGIQTGRPTDGGLQSLAGLRPVNDHGAERKDAEPAVPVQFISFVGIGEIAPAELDLARYTVRQDILRPIDYLQLTRGVDVVAQSRLPYKAKGFRKRPGILKGQAEIFIDLFEQQCIAPSVFTEIPGDPEKSPVLIRKRQPQHRAMAFVQPDQRL